MWEQKKIKCGASVKYFNTQFITCNHRTNFVDLTDSKKKSLWQIMSVIISWIIWDKTHILKPQMIKIVEDDIHSTIFGLKACVCLNIPRIQRNNYNNSSIFGVLNTNLQTHILALKSFLDCVLICTSIFRFQSDFNIFSDSINIQNLK